MPVTASSPPDLVAQLNANPADVDVISRLKSAGGAAEKEGRHEEAYVMFRALAEVDRNYWARVRELQKVMGPNRTHVAVLMFELTRAHEPAEAAKLEALLASRRQTVDAPPSSQAELERKLARDPADAQTRFELVKVYRSAGLTAEAAALLDDQADRYAKQGYMLKAMAPYRQAVELDGERLDILDKLARTEETLGLDEDAVNHLEELAARYQEKGMSKERMSVLDRLALIRKRANRAADP